MDPLTHGGSYVRDPVTGERRRVEWTEQPDVAPPSAPLTPAIEPIAPAPELSDAPDVSAGDPAGGVPAPSPRARPRARTSESTGGE